MELSSLKLHPRPQAKPPECTVTSVGAKHLPSRRASQRILALHPHGIFRSEFHGLSSCFEIRFGGPLEIFFALHTPTTPRRRAVKFAASPSNQFRIPYLVNHLQSASSAIPYPKLPRLVHRQYTPPIFRRLHLWCPLSLLPPPAILHSLHSPTSRPKQQLPRLVTSQWTERHF